MYLTQIEMEIMQAFWQANRPLTLSELIEENPNKSWKDRSGFSIISHLIEKGLLREDGFVHSGKTIARTFIPNLTYTDFMVQQLNKYDGNIEYSKLFACLLGDNAMNLDDIQQLDLLIEKKKKELGK